MLKTILFIFLFTPLFCQSQNRSAEKKIYFFLTKDSLLGVKDQAGKVIIKPIKHYGEWSQKELQTPIKEHLIFINYPVVHSPVPMWGSVFNRKGEFLYHPAAFDNDADAYVEGYQRFVKNNKMGFVNRNGDIMIDATHDYVDQFNYGIASYCDGCTWSTKGEHRIVTGGTWGYMNSKGETLATLNKPNSFKDQQIDSTKFLLYQFSYTTFEQKIIDSFYKLTDISKAYFVNYSNKLDDNERKIYYEIVERPSSFYPYYHVTGYTYSNKGRFYGDAFDNLNFYVTKDGKAYFWLDYDKKIPLDQWIKKQKKEASEYLIKHPDAPNRF